MNSAQTWTHASVCANHPWLVTVPEAVGVPGWSQVQRHLAFILGLYVRPESVLSYSVEEWLGLPVAWEACYGYCCLMKECPPVK